MYNISIQFKYEYFLEKKNKCIIIIMKLINEDK